MSRTPHIHERRDVFTSRPELAQAYAALAQIDGAAELGAFRHSQADLLERLSVVRGGLARIVAAADELSQAVFALELEGHEDGSSAARIVEQTRAIMEQAFVALEGPPPGEKEIALRLERISVLASQLKRALKDFDEDANQRQDAGKNDRSA